MLVTASNQIEQLFTSLEPEGQFIEYKKLPYKLIKSQLTSGDPQNLNQKHKHELLKDVCALLNSGGGTIILGIDEDKKTGAPLGAFENSGFDKTLLPDKYTETLESIILTGLSPTVQISTSQFDNPNNPQNIFISIKVSLQNYPLFSVLRDENGNDSHELFIRRGRNIGYMTVDEIRAKMQNYDQAFVRSIESRNRISEALKNLNKENPCFLLISTPITSNFHYDVLNSDGIENLMRGRLEEKWENDHYKISMDVTNLFTHPTFEGRKIEVPGASLEIWENGTVVFSGILNKDIGSKVLKLIEPSGSKIENVYKVINPAPIGGWTKNFLRFILQFYSFVNFQGEVTVSTHLLNLGNTTYAYKHQDKYNDHRSFSGNDQDRVSTEDIESYYGPKRSRKEDIVINTRLQTFDYKIDNLSALDNFAYSNILDYIWRAFEFDQFPRS